MDPDTKAAVTSIRDNLSALSDELSAQLGDRPPVTPPPPPPAMPGHVITGGPVLHLGDSVQTVYAGENETQTGEVTHVSHDPNRIEITMLDGSKMIDDPANFVVIDTASLDAALERLPAPTPPPPPVSFPPVIPVPVDPYELQAWPEPRPATGGETHHCGNQSSLTEKWGLMQPGDVLRIDDWPADEPIKLGVRFGHFSIGTQDRPVVVDIDRDLLATPPRGWAALELDELDDIYVLGLRSTGGDYTVRAHGCRDYTVADSRGTNTRHATFVTQRSLAGRLFSNARFFDIEAAGHDGSDDKYKSEGFYAGWGSGPADLSSGVVMHRARFMDKTEGAECKPGVTNFDYGFITCERIHSDRGTATTGAVSAWFTGNVSGIQSAEGRFHHIRVDDFTGGGHGAVTVGHGGIDVDNIAGKRLNGFPWSGSAQLGQPVHLGEWRHPTWCPTSNRPRPVSTSERRTGNRFSTCRHRSEWSRTLATDSLGRPPDRVVWEPVQPPPVLTLCSAGERWLCGSHTSPPMSGAPPGRGTRGVMGMVPHP